MEFIADRWRTTLSCLPAGVNLLAVSKGQPVSCIRFLSELGQCDFGESRFQEALPKLNALNETPNLRWHFIGKLQANKVRVVLKSFEVIHSVDSLSLAKRISRIAAEEKRCPEIMLQVKFRDDPTKGGFLQEELMQAWPELSELTNIRLVGLMTISPLKLDLSERKILFLECRALADALELKDCSMGMSSDWQQAVEAGSTWLRLGSSLFGDRYSHDNLDADINKDT